MVLAVDIGNSNVVIGCFEGKEILFTERLSTNRNSTAMEYVVLIKTVLELNGFGHQAFEGGIISSVVLNVLTGKAKKVSPLMYVLAALFVLKYIFL